MNELQGFQLRAIDGDVGEIAEFFFDDEKWTVRYVVVDTRGFTAHRVLISPISLTHTDANARTLSVSLTKDQIKGSPPPDFHRPVSRQYERGYSAYYGYTPYWGGVGYWGADPYPGALARVARERAAEQAIRTESERDGADTHLRSSRDVVGHHILATDGEIGHVDDFLVDDESWAIQYLRVDTSNWIGGKAVLVPQRAVRDVSWTEERIRVDMSKDQVWNSPEYFPARLNEDYERQLSDYYVSAHR